MEEILASIRRIISDEDTQAKDGDAGADASEDNPVEIEAADDMGDSAEMNQDDLDKLFDMDDDDDVAEPESEAAADDDMAAAMAEVAAEEEEEVEEDDDILELTEELELSEEDMAVAEDPMELVGGMPDDLDADGSDVAFVEEDEEPAVSMSALMAAAAPKPVPQSTIETAPVPDEDLPDVADDAPLTSEMTGEAVNAAFDNLSNLFVGGQAQTVEELIREMLRPMLKAWLDQNLPGMVEQMIKKEIERVTRRR